LFVSSDKGFFEGRDFGRGMARVLTDEAAEQGSTVRLVGTLAEGAEVLRDEVPALDQTAIARSIAEAVRPLMADVLSSHGFEAEAVSGAQVEAFATERVDVLSISFVLTFDLTDAASPDGRRQHATTRVPGSCSLVNDVDVEDLRIEHIALEWSNADGSPGQARTVFLGTATLHLGGPPPVPLTIRVAVD
jgi:hypothetical protein